MPHWKSLSLSTLDEVLDWAVNEPWGRAMRNCVQDTQWHSEGDVWTHTVAVCHQLTSVEGWEALSHNEQIVLRFAALLHDCAKPLTTMADPITGRVRSPKHAVKGEAMARKILRQAECPLEMREQICALVRYHSKPVFLPQSPQPELELELARISWLTRHDWLFVLAVADLRGRQSIDSQRSEDDLLWYRVLTQEHECFSAPYPLPNEQARFLLGRRKLSSLQYAPFEDFSCNATLMSGLPGSGKDTWLQRNRPGLPVVSLDAIRSQLDVLPEDNQGAVVQAARERCREFLRAKTSFALNATNTSQQNRNLWIDLLSQYNARIEIVAIENTLEETLDQNRGRQQPVPESVILRLADRFEPPTRLEGHTVQYVVSERLKVGDQQNQRRRRDTAT